MLNNEPARAPTELIRDSTRNIINYIKSPDIPFDRSINPYRGCEHGCIYCYARPSHAYLGFLGYNIYKRNTFEEKYEKLTK